MSAPDVLEEIKDDLGIAGTEDDAWLTRRIAGVWARMENYCGRSLDSPPVAYVDDWSKVILNGQHRNAPPILAFENRASVFLRHFPVVEVSAIKINNAAIDAALVRFDSASGKLVNLNGESYAVDLGQQLLLGGAVITYAAGFEELPPDLYECLLGAMTVLYGARQAQAAGGGAGAGMSAINVVDVGSIDFGNPNTFADAALKRSNLDPLLGPYVTLLDTFVDWRSMTGAYSYPASAPGVVVPLPAWNPNDKQAGVRLSDNDTVANFSWEECNQSARAVGAILPGEKKFFSVQYLPDPLSLYEAFGFATAAFPVDTHDSSNSSAIGVGESVGWWSTDVTTISVGDGATGVTEIEIGGPSWVAGDVVDCAVDRVANLVWFRINGGPWNNTLNGDPAAGTGGVAIPFGAGVPLLPLAQGYQNAAAKITLRAPFQYPPPVGFGVVS